MPGLGTKIEKISAADKGFGRIMVLHALVAAHDIHATLVSDGSKGGSRDARDFGEKRLMIGKLPRRGRCVEISFRFHQELNLKKGRVSTVILWRSGLINFKLSSPVRCEQEISRGKERRREITKGI